MTAINVSARPSRFALSGDIRQVLYRLAAVGLISLALSLVSDAFLTTNNVLNVLRQASLVFFMASGLTLVILTANLVEAPRTEAPIERDEGGVGHARRAYPRAPTAPPGARCGSQVDYGTRPDPLRAAAFRL